LFEQRVVVREKRSEFLGPMRPREEDIGDESRLLMHRDNAAADIVRKPVQLGNREAADRMHGASVSPLQVPAALKEVRRGADFMTLERKRTPVGQRAQHVSLQRIDRTSNRSYRPFEWSMNCS